ncbi:hypothetical protein JL720_10802 [Aureococcus anophagefferens]|nr:hypothetical protein JL720_10802 [Aureococcus anophagefferens]
MAPLQLAHETLLRRHQLRGSVLPILTMAYNASRQHLLTADEQALRLFSTRKELSVLWLDPESPSPMILLHHAIHDVYIVVYDDQPADHPDACAVQILHASLAPLLRWRPHDGAVAAAVLHPSPGVLVTSGSEGQLRLWQLSAAPSSPGGGSRRGEAEPPKDDLALIVSPVASLNEHQPRGAISTLHVSSGDGGLLIGAIDGTVWVWRLFPSPSDSTALTVASRPGSPEISPPPGGVAPRLVLCWEATPPADDGDDDDEAPSITCLQTLDAGRIAVGFDDGVVAIWGIQLFDGFGSAAAGSAPELCCTIDAHVLEPESDDDDSSSDEESSDEESELEEDDDDDDKQKDKEDRSQSAAGSGDDDDDDDDGVSLPDESGGVFEIRAVQATIKATPMRLELLELGMGAESIARRLLLAATSGGLVTLYEILAPEWRVATCADRLLQLRRGALVDWEEKAGEAAALGVALGWMPASASVVVGRSDGVLEVVAPDWKAALLELGCRAADAARAKRRAATPALGGSTVTLVCVGDAEGGLRLWTLRPPHRGAKCLWSTDAHTGAVVALAAGALSAVAAHPAEKTALKPLGRRLGALVASAAADGVVKLWRLVHGGRGLVTVGYFIVGGAVTALAVATPPPGDVVDEHRGGAPSSSRASRAACWRRGRSTRDAAGEAEPSREVERSVHRSGHLHEVTALDAFPGQGVLLSASLDRSVALWRARPADDAGLELLKCVALGHPIYSAVLVRRRGALDAIVADGAHVSRVSLRGDAAAVEGPSLLNERSHRVSRVSLAQSSTISGTAASTPQLAADPRPPAAGVAGVAGSAGSAASVDDHSASLSFATVSLQAPSAAQAFASAAALGDLVSSGALPRQSEIARSSFLGGNLRARTPQPPPPPRGRTPSASSWLASPDPYASGDHSRVQSPWRTEREVERSRRESVVTPGSAPPRRDSLSQGVWNLAFDRQPTTADESSATGGSSLATEKPGPGQHKRATFPTSKAPISAVPGPGEYLFAEAPDTIQDISAKLLEQTAAFAPALPASRERRENLPAMGSRPATADEDLAAYPDLVVAFKQRDLGKGFLPGAALPMVLKNWWKGPDGLPITDAHVLEACLKTTIFREADEEAAASMGDEEDDDDFDVVSIDELRNLREIRLERRKNYKRRGAKVTFDELCLVAEKLCGVVGAAPPREGGLNVSRTLSRGGGGWVRREPSRDGPAKAYRLMSRERKRLVYGDNVPEPFEHLFVDPLMQTARDCLATGNPNPSGSGFEQDGDAPQPPVMNGRTAVREARRVFEGYAEELASAAATKRPPRGLAEATYLLFRQRFGPRQIAEAHIVALLDALFAHGTEAPVLGALSRFIDVKPALVEMFEDGRASLGDNDSHQSAPRADWRALPINSARTYLAPSPSVASTVVEALANVPGLDESPLGHWDEHVDAEAFAELLTTRVVAADEVTRAAQAKLFALERPDRVLSTAGSGKGKPSKRGSRGDKDAAWPESLKELKRLLLRFVAADPARSGAIQGRTGERHSQLQSLISRPFSTRAISGAAFCRAMRVGLKAKGGDDGGWGPWTPPSELPRDESLLAENERGLQHLLVFYRDMYDQQVAYIDFWAMLWTEATLHRRLPLLEELYAIAIDQLIGIDDEVGAALRAFVMHVDRKELPKVEEKDKREDAPGPGRPVLEPVEVKPSLLALAFPGQLDMGDLDRVPDLHPGTLTIARPPDAARDRERDVFGDTEGASRAATAHDEREDRPDRSISEERRASLREKSTSTRASGVALVQDDVSSHVDVAPEPPEAFRPAASFSRSLQSSASRDDFRDESVDVHSTIQTLPRSFTAAGAQAAAQLMLDGLARHHAAEALTHARAAASHATLALTYADAALPAKKGGTILTRLAASGPGKPPRPPQSMTGQYDSFGRAFSPVRYLSLDEAEQLQRDIDAAQDEADAKRLAKTHSKAVAPKEKPKKVDKAAEQRRLLEEEAKRRQEEAMRRHEEELERRRQEEEAQAKAAEEAKKRAEEKAAMDEAAAKKKAEEEEAARLKAEQERRLKDLEAAKQAEAREKAEAKRRQAEEERAAADAEKKRLKEVAAAEKEARKQAEREARKRQEGERQAMYQEERLGHMMREQLREERAAAERKRLQDIKDAEIAREAEENRLMEEAEEEGEFLREEEREKARAAQEALEREKQEREREEFERAEREREYEECYQMQAEEEYERQRLAVEAEEERKRKAKEEALRERLDAEGRMKEENERSTMITNTLKVRPTNAGLFRVAKQKRASIAFKDKLLGKVAQRRATVAAAKQAEEEAAKLEAEAAATARKMGDLSSMMSATTTRAPGASTRRPLEDDRLPEAVLRCFREAAGGGPQAFYDAVSDLYTPEEEAAGANEADVVVAHPNVWEKYFEAKLDEVFRTDDVANPRTAKESPEDHRARLEDVLRQSSGLFAALGNRRAKDLLGDANTQDAARARAYRRVLAGRPEDGGSVATQQSADLGAANMPSPDDTAPLAFGVVKHASGDADLLVSRGRIPSASDADWQDTSLGQEKRVVVAPEDDRYGSGKHAIAIRATHADGCSFAVYAATTGATKASVASEPMRALEPRLRKLKLLGEMGTGALLRDFGAAANDAAELVAREVALEQAIASGMRADELVSRSDFQSEQKRNEELRREAKRVAMEVGSKRDLGDAAAGDEAPGPAAAPGDIEPDHIDAKLDQRDLEEAWNVSLSELDNEDNAEDAVAFEKLLYRVGVAQMQAENASKPLQRDRHLDARAPASTSSPGKRKKRRRRKKRSEVMEPGETVDDLDARMRAFVGTNGNWNKGVNARKAPREPFRLKVPKPLKYHLLLDDCLHQPPKDGES